MERNREQSVAAFKTYLQLIPQVTETAEQALKDRLIFGKNFCVERIEESDTDTFVRLLRIYCQSTTAQGVSQITTAVAKKLGDRDFERQLWEEQEFRKLAHDDVCGPVLDGLIRFDI